jgi:hypothetical protein
VAESRPTLASTQHLFEALVHLSADEWERIETGLPRARAAYGECRTDELQLLAYQDGRYSEMEDWVGRLMAAIPTAPGMAWLSRNGVAMTALSAVFCADLAWPELLRSACAPIEEVVPIWTLGLEEDIEIAPPADEVWGRFLQRVGNLTGDKVSEVAHARLFAEVAFADEISEAAVAVLETIASDPVRLGDWAEATRRVSGPLSALDPLRGVFDVLGGAIGWDATKTATWYANTYADQEDAFQRAFGNAVIGVIGYGAVEDSLVARLYLPFNDVVPFRTLEVD